MKRLAASTQLDVAGALAASFYILLAWRSRLATGPGLATFLGCMAVAWVALLIADRGLRRSVEPAAGRRIAGRIVIWAVLFRAAGLLADPILEDDWYRYLWDGYRFAEAGSPYGDPPLSHFGDEELPPGFAVVLDNVNNPDLPTIYGPLTELAFLASFLAAPAKLLPLKLLLLLAELVTLWLLSRWPLSYRCRLLWMWCPLLIVESAFNAHPESLGLLALTAALFSVTRGSGYRTALFAALAAGCRQFAALIAPLLLCRRSPSTWLLFTASLASFYLPFLLHGSLDPTSLGAMAGGWEFNSSGYALLSSALGPATARIACGLLFAAVYVVLLVRHARSADPLPRGDLVYGLLFLLSPVLNPWYLLWLLPFAVLRPSRWAWTALVVVSLSYVHGMGLGDPTLGSYEHPWWLRPLEFGSVLVALGFDLLRSAPPGMPRADGPAVLQPRLAAAARCGPADPTLRT